MGLRNLYDRVEQVATPIANQVTRTDEFAQLLAVVGSVNKTVRQRTNNLAARAWHSVNLPAGTDVRRLRHQVGSLDREVRLLSLEFQRCRKEWEQNGDSGRKHD